MSATTLIPPPRVVTRDRLRRRPKTADASSELIVAFATAEDVESGMTRVVEILRRRVGAERVEWWALSEDRTSFGLRAADGRGRGPRVAHSVGAIGTLVVAGRRSGRPLEVVVNDLAAVVRRRGNEERLAAMAGGLLRRYEELDDFAALVAHDLKTALSTIDLEPDPSAAVERALSLVDGILEAERAGSPPDALAPVEQCIEDALQDLGRPAVSVEAALPAELPLSAAALRIVLRNVIANAVAAGARHLRLSAVAAAGSLTVAIDDDGAGIGAAENGRYAGGSGLGFTLCRRIVERAGGLLELGPAPGGGARATLVLARR